MEEKWKKVNPVLSLDYPDPDVIRVDDTYYMVSTTMHFMPGCVILRSYNLADWEIYSYVYETLEPTDQECLKNGKNAYGQGMWAATLRYEKGMFYLLFVANDTGKTYLFRASDLKGPWQKNEIEGFYHDCSLLFDEGSAFLAYGNRQIYVMELNEEMTAPKEGGLHKLLVEDPDEVYLGYEGTHWYKINGKYYLFFIHYRTTSSEMPLRALKSPYQRFRFFAEMTGILLSIKYPLLFLFELCFCQTGCEVDEKHQDQQHCADAPGGGEVAVLEGPQIEQDGEGRAVGCVSLGDAARNDFRRTGGEEQGRTLTHDTAHGQDAAGDDAVDAAGQHDGADDVPLARAQTQRALMNW